MNRELRMLINDASLKVFGTKSRWAKAMRTGERMMGVVREEGKAPKRVVKTVYPTLPQMLDTLFIGLQSKDKGDNSQLVNSIIDKLDRSTQKELHKIMIEQKNEPKLPPQASSIELPPETQDETLNKMVISMCKELAITDAPTQQRGIELIKEGFNKQKAMSDKVVLNLHLVRELLLRLATGQIQ